MQKKLLTSVKVAVLLALATATTCAPVREGGQQSTPSSVAAPAPRAPSRPVLRYGRFELAIGDAPRNADRVEVGEALGQVDIVAPSGRTFRVDPFVAGDRVLVRFAPAEMGSYRYVVRRPSAADVTGRFESISGADRGPVGIDPNQPHRLSFRDGTPFFILGENRINIYDSRWNWEHMGIADYVRYMANNGMTTLRVFVMSDAEQEENPGADKHQAGCIEPKLGHFDERSARTFDSIMEAAEANGIYVVLTAYSIGLTPNDTWKSWEDNAYNVLNGGPATKPEEVFTRQDLRAAAKRKLRYLLARYGYSSHLLAVDLLNEPEWDGPVPEPTWIPWAIDLAADWHSRDPYGHLVTVGPVGLEHNVGSEDERPLYANKQDDMVQWHLYGKETYDPHDHAVEMARRVEETYGFGKPVFCGEFAYGGEDHALYDHTHTGIWAATFAGGGALAHSAPPFNLDSDEPMSPERGKHFRVLSDFLRTLDWSRKLEPDPAVAAATPGLRAFALGSPSYKAFWLLGPKETYGSSVDRAELLVRGLPAGLYRVEWSDDTTGERIANDEVRARGSEPTVLHVPRFTRHVAGKLLPAN